MEGNSKEKIFATGIRFFPKHEKQPDFVLGSMVITKEDLIDWLLNSNDAKEHSSLYDGKEQIKFQITTGRNGGMIASVDTYKPSNNRSQEYSPPKAEGYMPTVAESTLQETDPSIKTEEDDLPF